MKSKILPVPHFRAAKASSTLVSVGRPYSTTPGRWDTLVKETPDFDIDKVREKISLGDYAKLKPEIEKLLVKHHGEAELWALLGQCNRDSRRVTGNPPTTPLLGHASGCPRAAGWI